MVAKLHVLVCLDGHPKSHTLVAAAKRMALELGCSWSVFYVELAYAGVGRAARKEAAVRILTEAENAGARVLQSEHFDARAATLDYINSCLNAGEVITHIIIGQHAGTISSRLFQRSTVEEIARRYGQTMRLTTIPLEGDTLPDSLFWDHFSIGSLTLRSFATSTVTVGFALFITQVMQWLLPASLERSNWANATLVFLFAVVFISLRLGLLPAMVASLLSVAAIDYFYTAPIYQFNIGQVSDLISSSIFLSVAAVVSIMGGNVRANAKTALDREERSRALYDISRLTADATNQHQILEILDREVHDLLDMDIVILLARKSDSHALDIQATDIESDFDKYPAEAALEARDLEAVAKCWNESLSSGFGTMRGMGSSWRFEVLETANNRVGVFGIKVPLKKKLDTGFGQFTSMLADQIALTIERAALVEQMNESRFREERETLRSMLLSSVSHDLKTPLASIIGSISVMRSLRKNERLTPEQEDVLTKTALEEAQRLDSFITNILSMTRIDSGDIEFSIRPNEPMKPLQRVIKSLRSRLEGRDLVIDDQSKGLPVEMDAMMTGQVLQNVIDNAVKYSPEGTPVTVSLHREDHVFRYVVRDRGMGIPTDKLDRIFDKYERLNHTDSQVAGTGLGLAIARSVMEAQGGSITVGNHPDGGAEFTLVFQIEGEEKEGDQV